MRLTIDLDYPSVFRIVKVWFSFPGHSIKGRLSSSHDCPHKAGGVHIEGWGCETDDPIAQRDREILGDDHTRIYYDESKLWRASQVLYDRKYCYRCGQYHNAGPWVETLDSLIDQYQQSTGKQA